MPITCSSIKIKQEILSFSFTIDSESRNLESALLKMLDGLNHATHAWQLVGPDRGNGILIIRTCEVFGGAISVGSMCSMQYEKKERLLPLSANPWAKLKTV